MYLGTGKAGSFTFKIKDSRSVSGLVSIFTIWLTNWLKEEDSALQLAFGPVKTGLGDTIVESFWEKFSKLEFVKKKWDKVKLINGHSPSISLKEAFPNKESLELFKSLVLEFVNEVREREV